MKRIYDILTIMLKYDPDAEISAGHEIIWFGGPTKEELSAEDAKKLEELRCRWDDSVDSWAAFV